jgi:transcriptional regulator with XRE-family HTH domain
LKRIERSARNQNNVAPAFSPASAEVRKKFGEDLRKARETAGLTQGMVAQAAGRDRAYVSAVERGVHNVTVETMIKLARAVGRDVTVLLTPAKKR